MRQEDRAGGGQTERNQRMKQYKDATGEEERNQRMKPHKEREDEGRKRKKSKKETNVMQRETDRYRERTANPDT